MRRIGTVAMILLLAPAAALCQDEFCGVIAGAVLIADDGTFLGRFTNEYDSESVLNEYGDYGSKYSAESIWNEYGTYGSKYSAQSPFNSYSGTPPAIVSNGKVLGYLTVAKAVRPALNPSLIRACEFS